MTPDSNATNGLDLSSRVGRVAAPLREQVVELLREAILDFRLKPGQRLIERELIEQTGVSRTTIREVLRQLAAEGLVTTIPQRGAVVMVPSPQEAADIYELRAALESLAARRFTERASEQQLKDLRKAFREIERLSKRKRDADVQTMLQAKDHFYDVLLEGSGNSVVRSMLEGLHARVRVLRATSLSQPDRPAGTLQEIRALVEALEARDGDAAAEAAAAHVNAAARAGLQGLAEMDPAAAEILESMPALQS